MENGVESSYSLGTYRSYKIKVDNIITIEDIKTVLKALNITICFMSNNKTISEEEISSNQHLFEEVKEKENGEENNL